MFGVIVKPPVRLEVQIWNWGHNPFSKDHHTPTIACVVSSDLPAHVQSVNALQWRAWAKMKDRAF